MKIPFTDYDFWAYLSAGFLFLFALDYVLQTGVLLRPEWTVVQGVVATSCAYVLGHIFAGLSSAIFEERVLGLWLGKPRDLLFGTGSEPKWFRFLFPTYFKALPEETQRAALMRAASAGIMKPGEGMFWVAYDAARNNKVVMDRMNSFLNLYGFCRNVAFVAFVDAVVLAVSHYYFEAPKSDLWWALAAVVIGICMFFRYLKFYRHFALEVYTSYAAGNNSAPNLANRHRVRAVSIWQH